ncbi:MAG: sigma 54-dependent Fis family transcriptional regulator [Labilithrix sp.]|nr:sigma 54-dependent Fis family transcriptional regulator [Labilithrix sp.]MCW5810522.1 sigma 54-dependent Fis family transcriptional regulator [Labilithrix sp.]
MARPKGKGGPPQETQTIANAHRMAQPLGAIVRVMGARATPKDFRLERGTCILGAGADSDVRIENPNVSRSHVELGLVPEGISVRDLGSRNGTFYLGQRVQGIVLAPGARIHLGPVEVALDPDLDAIEGGEPYPEPVYRGMIGASLRMRSLFGALARLEGSLVTVLVTGESGVGKELVSRALHEGSTVAQGPLVTVNCGAIAPELVASELFGHKRGAFTGASEQRKGAFESADGGTLFLDEIGELPLDVQPMLLRALESGEIRPVGSDRSQHVRVRVVAATHRDLRSEVRAGRFREDLYYRIAVVELAVPPLRERVDDVADLATRFAHAAGLRELPPPVIERLRARRWPGNVRELRNVVQAFAALGRLPGESAPPGAIAADSIEGMIDVTRPYADQKDELVERFTQAYLARLMQHTGGNQSAAARLSGLDRSWLWRLLLKHGIAKG